MQSSGGILSARAAAREPVRTILSGPAGGVLGAQYVSEIAGFDRIITFDMGGTSTDVSLMESGSSGSLATTSESIVSGLPVAVPMLDIHTVGAGGGSLARFDRAGALRVGPESAGADPGPICYGRGNEADGDRRKSRPGADPRVRVAGRRFRARARRARELHEPSAGPDAFGGRIRARNRGRGECRHGESHSRNLGRARARPARLHAGGIWRRGRAACLRPGGGAGNSARAGAVHSGSAFGAGNFACRCDKRFVAHDSPGHSKRRGNATRSSIRRFAELRTRGPSSRCAPKGFQNATFESIARLDMRYSGQSYELTVPFAGDIHRRVPSRARAALRLFRPRAPVRGRQRPRAIHRAHAKARPAKIESGRRQRARGRCFKSAVVMFAGRRYAATDLRSCEIGAGNRIAGPAIVTEYSATTFIPPRLDGPRGSPRKYHSGARAR